MQRKLNRRRVAIIGIVVLAIGSSIGLARAGTAPTDILANTAGHGASPPTVTLSGLGSVPAFAQTVLADRGAKLTTVLARSGDGDTESVLLAAQVGALVCLTATHAGGTIVEPLNCAQDAYLRVWSDANGSATTTASSSFASQRVIAFVSHEVATVSFTLADGSTHEATPDMNGVALLEVTAPTAKVDKVEALSADGKSLGSIHT